MRLMYPEVDIIPGRAGQRPQITPVREEQPLPGSSVIRLNNTTTQENAFTIHVRSEEKFWQEGWYTVVALPPGQGAENAPPPGKPDQRGPQDRWVKIYVPRGGARDVLIRFNVPAVPESRAGRYKYFVEVETQIIGPTEGGRRKERVTQVPGVATVRPYYKWSMDLSPEERKVGRRDRSADFEVVVTNEGNDWLYCDMQLPRPKDMTLDSPTLRLAVPPPEPGETLPSLPGSTEPRVGTQRTVPLSAVTKLKVFRGELTRQPIQLSAQRVDAPSVPPPATDGYAGMGAVVAAPTTEKAQVGDRALIYHPPVPAKFTDFFTRGATSLRTMAFGLVGIAAAAVMMVYLYQNAFYEGVKVEPNSLTAQAGKPLLVSGQFLIGCKMYMGTKGNWIEVPYKNDPFRANSRATITAVPQELDHKVVKVMAQRWVAILPFMAPLLPHNESKSLVQVGSMVVTAGPPTVDPVDGGPFKPGDHITITGKNLGSSGAVVANGVRVSSKAVLSWASDKIVFAVPYAAPGATVGVKVVPEGSAALDASAYQINPPTQVVSKPPGGSTAKPGGTTPGKTSGNGKPGGGTPTKPGGGQTPTKLVVVPPPIHPGNPNSHVAVIVHPPPPVKVVTRVILGTPPYDLILNGSYPGAIGAAEDRLKLKPSSVDALALQAYAMIKINQVGQAGPLIARAAALNPTNPRAKALVLVAQGALADAQGNTDAAGKAYFAADHIDNTLGLVYLAAVDHFVKIGKPDVAKALLLGNGTSKGGLDLVKTPAEKDALHQKIAGLQ
jgi:hypothetical protein